MTNKQKAIDRYNHHVQEVKANVPPDKLLIFTVDQGWEPLCNFLKVPIPATDFPNVNDRAEIKKTLAGLTKGAYFILAGAALLALLIIYALVLIIA